ncbi:hypothetical protein TNCT_530101 [Trichonephila clavata]|uniref:Secreted protein n=1 Tax=Trichonephila clavata TaxID=2740835 RepID=A0A8X6LQF1_TRICU|nr:hypothetical protein TNCT_530101 [Trichonephila clavata]
MESFLFRTFGYLLLRSLIAFQLSRPAHQLICYRPDSRGFHLIRQLNCRIQLTEAFYLNQTVKRIAEEFRRKPPCSTRYSAMKSTAVARCHGNIVVTSTFTLNL